MKVIKIPLSVTNCFLLKYDRGYILIDTGYEADWETFCNSIKKENISLNSITHIILTHHHDDHCGLINNILRENEKIIIVMSHLSKDLLLKGKNDQSHGGGLINKRIRSMLSLKQLYLSLLTGKHISKNSNLMFTPYIVRENDILVSKETKLCDIGINLKGKIIETPGHTIDSISIVFDDGSCFVGDAAANFLNFAGTKYCVIFVMDIDQYYDSWEKIINENVTYVYPAHGQPFSIFKLKRNIRKNKKENIAYYK